MAGRCAFRRLSYSSRFRREWISNFWVMKMTVPSHGRRASTRSENHSVSPSRSGIGLSHHRLDHVPVDEVGLFLAARRMRTRVQPSLKHVGNGQVVDFDDATASGVAREACAASVLACRMACESRGTRRSRRPSEAVFGSTT
jgi:hypothetical protein